MLYKVMKRIEPMFTMEDSTKINNKLLKIEEN